MTTKHLPEVKDYKYPDSRAAFFSWAMIDIDRDVERGFEYVDSHTQDEVCNTILAFKDKAAAATLEATQAENAGSPFHAYTMTRNSIAYTRWARILEQILMDTLEGAEAADYAEREAEATWQARLKCGHAVGQQKRIMWFGEHPNIRQVSSRHLSGLEGVVELDIRPDDKVPMYRARVYSAIYSNKPVNYAPYRFFSIEDGKAWCAIQL